MMSINFIVYKGNKRSRLTDPASPQFDSERLRKDLKVICIEVWVLDSEHLKVRLIFECNLLVLAERNWPIAKKCCNLE